ncbi:hypothetical protein BABINDRAFT_30649 [Babjeviella inositovora NRRL Y-12698]|uniref:Mitochondrial thiamine pyrophosphate carrier 1 n=1 Tax=Babjeviella inositovora NRRL Y-12698 TaxID=984486 RepID=A0A1E3QZS7_9ASCO|nr:uncharacterized protein BABINDRAFT_30649 [Babjeviella inositovora NRRL Y-12698]ODQ82582.1 hypothetical protein BABINDRAFT_30649 [Babjeviella inositovora NRRL Y-12698]
MSTESYRTAVAGLPVAPPPQVVEIGEIDYEALPENASLSAHLVAGALAGTMEHAVMYPVDSLKTRIQTSLMMGTTQASKQLGGVISSCVKIVSQEGIYSLWRGSSSIILGAGPAHAVYFGVYELAKEALIDERKRHDHNPVQVGVAGAAATITSELFMNPFDVVKQHMQLQTLAKSSFINTTKHIYQHEGLKAFYLSYPTTLAMTVPFTVLQFTIYDSTLKVLNPGLVHNPFMHCIAGGVAGGLAAAITTPLDCVKTLLQVRGESTDPRVMTADSMWKGAKALYAIDGMNGFWKGLRPRIVSNVPSTALCWTVYEMAKYYLMLADKKPELKLA